MIEQVRDPLPPDAIAIIGMAGRFPGAGDVRQFWKNLLDGRESITFFSPEELDPAVAHLTREPNYVRAKGVLKGVECFDASFFGLSPVEARMVDPQQRILLELAWSALEDAGYGSGQQALKVGVYVGTNWNRYVTQNLHGDPELLVRYGEFNTAIANEGDFPATRLSYRLNLTGPSVSVFTACSTGLVAVAEAVKSLLSYECDMALAGGASVSLPQRQGYLYQEGGMLSRDGHTRSFDADGSGTTFNEGAALVLLKRLDEAVADRDHIYAVIRGAAINNDGADKMSFTAPSVAGQAEVIAMALGAADVEPDSITYVEAHGTATPLGDPIEVEALTQVYRRSSTAGAESCVLGAVKSNVGHLIHAAGTAGLIKMALAAKHGIIPGTLHFQRPNPALNLDQTRFRVTPATEPWAPDQWPRRGAVSSFGVGGTNAHVVVEQPPETDSGDAVTRVPVALLSCRYESGLTLLAQALAERLDEDPELKVGDVAFTLAVGRKMHQHRLAVVAADRAELIEGLRGRRGPRIVAGDGGRPSEQLVFAFPGQGSQRPGIGNDLYQESPAFREAMNECLAVSDVHLDIDLRELTVNVGSRDRAAQLLEKTCYTQPALFATEYALARHLLSLHVRPDVMVGHSVGEFVAAAIAGIMAPVEGMRLIIERGRLMQDMPPGGMLALGLSELEASKIGADHELQVAAINAPDLTVLSGQIDRIEAVERLCRDQGIDCKRLRTSHGFHSSMMDPAVEAFGAAVARLNLSPPSIPIISTATGEMLTDEQATSPGYWQSHLRVPVRFSAALGTLLARGRSGVIELGPGGTLTSLAQRQASDEHAFVASLGLPEISESQSVMVALARLWVRGAAIPWTDMFGGEKRFRVSLPTYPFERQRHWVEPAGNGRATAPSEPLLSAHAVSSSSESAMESGPAVVAGTAGPAEVIQLMSTSVQSPLEALIAEQLVLMARQLELLNQQDSP
jgi:acyl transferase domain-containing protein